MATLESHNHIIGDIEHGVKIYNSGNIEFSEREPNCYWAHVPHKRDTTKAVAITFSRDGQNLEHHYCYCTWNYKNPPVRRHIVAAVLAIQGGVAESKLTLGKTATVTDCNAAKVVGSGNLDMFSTPMTIALMEQAACEYLVDVLESRQTSVGTRIDVAHTATSPIDTTITVTATIEYVFGDRVEFKVVASDEAGKIGSGKHTRVIVDAEKFTSKRDKDELKTHNS